MRDHPIPGTPKHQKSHRLIPIQFSPVQHYAPFLYPHPFRMSANASRGSGGAFKVKRPPDVQQRVAQSGGHRVVVDRCRRQA